MNIITKESLVEGFVKSILKEMFSEYERYERNIDHAGGISFDEYVFQRLNELGQATYNAIGELYGDCDDAINEVM